MSPLNLFSFSAPFEPVAITTRPCLPAVSEMISGYFLCFLLCRRSRWAERHDVFQEEVAEKFVVHFLRDEDTTACCGEEYHHRLALALIEMVTLEELEDWSSEMQNYIEGTGNSDMDAPGGLTWVQINFTKKKDPLADEPCDEDMIRQLIADIIAGRGEGRLPIEALPDASPPSLEGVFAAASAAAAIVPPVKLVRQDKIPLPSPLSLSTVKSELSTHSPPDHSMNAVVRGSREDVSKAPSDSTAISLEVQHWTFSNGATLTFCRTPFSSDTITFGAIAIGGWREISNRELCDRYLGEVTAAINGIDTLKTTELSDAIATKEIDAWVESCCYDNYRAMTGGCAPRNLADALNLTCTSLRMIHLLIIKA